MHIPQINFVWEVRKDCTGKMAFDTEFVLKEWLKFLADRKEKILQGFAISKSLKTSTKSAPMGGGLEYITFTKHVRASIHGLKGKEACARSWSWARSFWLYNTETTFCILFKIGFYLKRSANMAASRVRKYFLEFALVFSISHLCFPIYVAFILLTGSLHEGVKWLQ